MDRIWLQNYQTGVPHDINLSQYTSVVDLMEKSFTKYKDMKSFTCMGKSLTYEQLDQYSRHLGAYFTQSLGLGKGDRVAIMMPNILQYPIALCATLRTGLVVVNINPLYTARELEHQLNDAGVETIVILENFANTLAEVIDKTQVKHVLVTSIGEMLGFFKGSLVNFVLRRIKKMVPPIQLKHFIIMRDAIDLGRTHQYKQHDVTQEDLAFLQYTGGTTGVSKGAMLTHGNMVANLLQAYAWMSPYVREGEEIIITALPLYHIFSLTANCLTFMKVGGHNVLITNPRDIVGFIKTIKKYPFTAFTGVNTLFNALLNHPDFPSVDFSKLKLTLGGGMAVQKIVAEKWKKITSVPLIQAYGLTETSPAVCINPLNLMEFNGSIGLPVSSTLVSIRDEKGKEVAINESGELCVKGPQVMKGYWNRPEETKIVFTEDGWLRTGDIAIMDPKGYFTVVDRKKDMIIVSGFNVYPNEIEDVVCLYPGILEACAVGVEDEKSGEAVKIFVVKKDPKITADEILNHCRKNLTGYKIPKHVEFRKELPKTNVGKILRRSLRENLA